MSRRYNVAGQLVQQVEKDNRGELISQFDFSYDAAGNILKEQKLPKPESVSLPPVTMTYSVANRLATYNGQAVQFDADGNLVFGPLSGEMANFSFDSRNRLVQAGETSYRYDAENQRVGVNQTRYVVNSQSALSQVLVKEENGVKTFYVYGLGLVGDEKDGEYRAYHFDFRGSTVALTDNAGKVVQRFQYGPYGELVKGDASQTPFLFNGKYGVMTEGNGLYYMRARFYSPEMKRFVNMDVLLGNLSEGQSLNRYAFVTGQPVNLVDPFGLEKYCGQCATTDCLLAGGNLCTDKGAGRTFWKIALWGTPLLEFTKGDLSIAKSLLLHSLQDNPSDLYYFGDSQLVNKIKSDKDYQGLVNGLIAQAQQGGRNWCYQAPSRETPIQFSTGDLFFAIGKAFIEVNGQQRDGKWLLNVQLLDTYNFEHNPNCEYGNSDYHKPACVLNEMATKDNALGIINSYQIKVLFFQEILPK